MAEKCELIKCFHQLHRVRQICQRTPLENAFACIFEKLIRFYRKTFVGLLIRCLDNRRDDLAD